MTIRAVILGLTLGLLISLFAAFNNQVIHQTFLISNHFPIAVFGAVVLIVMAINPLLSLVRPGWMMRGPELMLIAAIAMAACAWPTFSFYRTFIVKTAMPAVLVDHEPSWQSSGVMSYVPGGSAELADGHVADWPAFLAWLAGGESDGSSDAQSTLWQGLPGQVQRALSDAAISGDWEGTDHGAVLRSVNLAMGDRMLWPGAEAQPADADIRSARMVRLRRNRAGLVEALPDAILPAPSGGGWLMNDPAAIDQLVGLGSAADRGPLAVLRQVHWRAWLPTLALWGSVALLMALAMWCMAVIVHPQWSRSELLSYPVVRLLTELVRHPEGSSLPTVFRQNAFWATLIAVTLLHLLNGLHAWFPSVPQIGLTLELEPLSDLFPNASQVYGSWKVFQPTLYLSVIALAFFLKSEISLSVGLAQLAYMALGAAVIGSGGMLSAQYLEAENANLLRFGAYAAMLMIVLYTGRAFYLRVALGAVGVKRGGDVPSSCVWAARLLALASVGAVVVLSVAGASPLWAAAGILLVLLTALILSRIVAETGLFFVQAWWLPVGVLAGLFGFEFIGPTDYIILALLSMMLLGDPRTLLMPYLSNGLKAVDATEPKSTAPASRWMLAMVVVGFFAAGAAMFALQHGHGVTGVGDWAVKTFPSMPFESLSRHLAVADSKALTAPAVQAQGWDRLSLLDLDGNMLSWCLVGAGLVLVAGFARIRWARWPIHPVLFLVWGTMPAARMCVSFMIGWAIKVAVVNITGARGYQAMMPIVLGVLVGEIGITLLWVIVGLIYYALTGQPPVPYSPYP